MHKARGKMDAWTRVDFTLDWIHVPRDQVPPQLTYLIQIWKIIGFPNEYLHIYPIVQVYKVCELLAMKLQLPQMNQQCFEIQWNY